MTVLTIAWITLSLFVGLTIYLLPKLDRYLAFGMVLLSGGYGVQVLLEPKSSGQYCETKTQLGDFARAIPFLSYIRSLR